MLFQEILNGPASWGRIFQSIPAFEKLAREAFARAGLPIPTLSPLKPGTNAVFRAGEFVIKIFAPAESEFGDYTEFEVERDATAWAHTVGVPAPHILAEGVIEDRYRFPYLILPFIAGQNPREMIDAATDSQRMTFIGQFKDALARFQQPVPTSMKTRPPEGAEKRLSCMQGLHPMLAEELLARAFSLPQAAAVLAHGDITDDNLLLNADFSFTLIDFADCVIAPPVYELPPILFELFHFHPAWVRAWVADDLEVELERLLDGLSLHAFCGNVLKDHFTRLQMPWDRIASISALRDHLRSLIA